MKTTGLLLANVCVAILISEILFLLAGPVPLFHRKSRDRFYVELAQALPGRLPANSLKPNAKGTLYGHEVRTNSLGFRGPEFTLAPKQRCILVIGRSYEFGWGSEQDAAWPAQLEEALRSEGEDLRVFNLSIPGWTLADAVMAMHHAVTAYQPDLVIFSTYPTDPHFLFLHLAYAEIQKAQQKDAPSQTAGLEPEPEAGALHWLRQTSDALQGALNTKSLDMLSSKHFLVSLNLQLQVALGQRQDATVRKIVNDPAIMQQGFAAYLQVLSALSSYCEAQSTRLLVFDNPGNPKIATYCQTAKIAYQASNVGEEKTRRKTSIGYGDGHPNRYGHSLIMRRAKEAAQKVLGR